MNDCHERASTPSWILPKILNAILKSTSIGSRDRIAHMNLATILSLLVQPTLQIALPTSAVYAIVRCVGRDPEHRAHLLWSPVGRDVLGIGR